MSLRRRNRNTADIPFLGYISGILTREIITSESDAHFFDCLMA